MGFVAYWTEKIRKYKWYDISLIKLATAAFILMIAKLWSPLLSFEWYWYGIVAVIAAVHPMMVMFKN